MSGALRWISWGDTPRKWHLRFGTEGPVLCDLYPGTNLSRVRWLAEGAPADRCPKCSEVIALRLGLPVPEGAG